MVTYKPRTLHFEKGIRSIEAKFGVPMKGDVLFLNVGTIVTWGPEIANSKDGNLIWIRNLSGLEPFT